MICLHTTGFSLCIILIERCDPVSFIPLYFAMILELRCLVRRLIAMVYTVTWVSLLESSKKLGVDGEVNLFEHDLGLHARSGSAYNTGHL